MILFFITGVILLVSIIAVPLMFFGDEIQGCDIFFTMFLFTTTGVCLAFLLQKF